MVIDIETLKKHLNLEADFTDDDAYLTMLEGAAELFIAKLLDTEAVEVDPWEPEPENTDENDNTDSTDASSDDSGDTDSGDTTGGDEGNTEEDDEEVEKIKTTDLLVYYQGNVPQLVKFAVMSITAYYYDQRQPVVTGISIAQLPLHVQAICNLLGNHSI